MIKISVSLCLWLQDGLDGNFTFPSSMRSDISLDLAEGACVRDALAYLSERYPVIAKKVYNRKAAGLNPNVKLIINKKVYPEGGVLDRVLAAGDNLQIIPVYVGG